MGKFLNTLQHRALGYCGENSAMIYADTKVGHGTPVVIAGDIRALYYCLLCIVKRIGEKSGRNLLESFEVLAEMDEYSGDSEVISPGMVASIEEARESAEKAERERTEREAALRRQLDEANANLADARAIIKGLKDDLQAERNRAWKISEDCGKRVLDLEHRMEEMETRTTWEEVNRADD